VLLLILKLPGGEVIAQPSTGDMLANDLRRNVVRVNSRWSDSPMQNGFGFVVGERAGLLYIVTAYHVVRNQQNSTLGAPAIIFYQDQGKEYQGDLLTTHLSQDEGDVAVIRVTPPPGFSWQPVARSSVPAERGDDVRFIGVEGQWLVPVKPGAVNNVEPNHAIRFEGLPIRTGTSGAPLVGNKGIVGMINTDDVFGFATPIDVIERAIRGWNYPWQLTTWSPPPPPPPPPIVATVTSPTEPSTTLLGGTVKASSPPQIGNLDHRYTTRDNRDLYLGDIPRPDRTIGTRNVDLAECERECTDNNDCVAFAYDRWNSSCYAKNKITQSLLEPHSMIAVKKPAELPNVSQKTPEMVILRNQHMRGDVMISQKTTSYAACSSACEDNLKCVAFNFLKRAGGEDNCRMFKLSDGHDNDNAVDAGYKHQVP